MALNDTTRHGVIQCPATDTRLSPLPPVPTASSAPYPPRPLRRTSRASSPSLLLSRRRRRCLSPWLPFAGRLARSFPLPHLPLPRRALPLPLPLPLSLPLLLLRLWPRPRPPQQHLRIQAPALKPRQVVCVIVRHVTRLLPRTRTRPSPCSRPRSPCCRRLCLCLRTLLLQLHVALVCVACGGGHRDGPNAGAAGPTCSTTSPCPCP